MPDPADSRWMPPSPHREAILEALHRGRAHLEDRGHDRPPLLIFEDGGAMELPLVRLVEGRLTAVPEAPVPAMTTRYTDVCGTIDELKRRWEQQPASDEYPETSLALLNHALAMLARMADRMAAYRACADRLTALAADMTALQHPDHTALPALADQLRAHMAAGVGAPVPGAQAPLDEDALAQAFALAESIRDLANNTEQTLYKYRDLAIEVGRLYESIRGARDWGKSEA